MANIEYFIPVFLNGETGVILDKEESLEELFNRSKKEGYKASNSVCGVNFEMYDEYRKSKGIEQTSKSLLKAIQFDEWFDIMSDFWDKCNADSIKNQRVANFIVDWFFVSNIECFHLMNSAILDVDSYEESNKLINTINKYDGDELLDKILIPLREAYTNSLDIVDEKKKSFIERFKKI